MSDGGFRDRLRTMAENVLTLEVNTILAPHIEAEKMPPPEHALIDIANDYRSWLRDEHNQPDMWRPDDVSEASSAVFTRIRDAVARIFAGREPQNRTDTNMLERIKGNADQLLYVFSRLDGAAGPGGEKVVLRRQPGAHRPEAVELLPEEIVVVRKAWELGLDEIVMQTTIQIDGDIMTRIRRGLNNEPDGPTIMKLHDKAVSTSTGFWSKLVDILGGAIRGLVDLLGAVK